MSASNSSQPEPNPYSPPASSFVAELQNPAAETGDGSPSETVIELLAQTRPWVILFSVLGFIGTAIIVCAAAVQAAEGVGRGDPGAMGGAMGMLIMAFVYFFPSLHLARFAARIGDLRSWHRQRDLEAALREQKSFWKFSGIVASLLIVLYGFIFLGAVLLGLLSR